MKRLERIQTEWQSRTLAELGHEILTTQQLPAKHRPRCVHLRRDDELFVKEPAFTRLVSMTSSMTGQAVAGSLKSLESAGLVKRYKDLDGRRWVTLTNAGQRACELR